MSETPEDIRPEERDVDTRSELLPEEAAPGTDAPREQAEAVLEESLERTVDPEGTQLGSTQTPDHGRTSDEPVT
jgi:hypothetical protein